MNHDSDHQPDQQAPRFMIIAQARSGSTFLREVLNAQPDITCHGEVFSRIWIDRLHPRPDIAPLDADQIRALLPLRDADPLAFMAEHIMAFPGSATGFKIIYDDFIDARFRDKLTAHALENDFEIIHLRRNNHLAAFVSRARMTRFGIGHSDRPQRRAEAEPGGDPQRGIQWVDHVTLTFTHLRTVFGVNVAVIDQFLDRFFEINQAHVLKDV